MAGQANKVCLCLLHSQLSVLCRGVCRWFGLWVNVVLCTLVCGTAHVLAGESRGRASHPIHSLCASPVCVHCARSRRYAGPGGMSPCVLTCPLQGSLPRGTLSWLGRRDLHNLCPTALFSVGPSTCWAQLVSKVTIKWLQLWYLLAPPGAQVKGMVASQRRGPEHPPVC